MEIHGKDTVIFIIFLVRIKDTVICNVHFISYFSLLDLFLFLSKIVLYVCGKNDVNREIQGAMLAHRRLPFSSFLMFVTNNEHVADSEVC